jgi:hypothetical protein
MSGNRFFTDLERLARKKMKGSFHFLFAASAHPLVLSVQIRDFNESFTLFNPPACYWFK